MMQALRRLCPAAALGDRPRRLRVERSRRQAAQNEVKLSLPCNEGRADSRQSIDHRLALVVTQLQNNVVLPLQSASKIVHVTPSNTPPKLFYFGRGRTDVRASAAGRYECVSEVRDGMGRARRAPVPSCYHWPSELGISPRIASRNFWRPKPNLRTPRDRPVIAQRFKAGWCSHRAASPFTPAPLPCPPGSISLNRFFLIVHASLHSVNQRCKRASFRD